MSWIIVDDKFALEATPDPAQLLTAEQMAELLVQKQREVSMYEKEIDSLTSRKEEIELEILEITGLIGE